MSPRRTGPRRDLRDNGAGDPTTRTDAMETTADSSPGLPPDAGDHPRVVELPAQPTAVVRGTVAANGLREFFDRAFRTLGEAVGRSSFSPAGPALSLYPSPPGSTVELEVGFPVQEPIEAQEPVVPGTLPAGPAVTCTHRGDYEGLGSSYERLQTWARANGVVLGQPLWEIYVTEPSPQADPADMVTQLFWAVRAHEPPAATGPSRTTAPREA